MKIFGITAIEKNLCLIYDEDLSQKRRFWGTLQKLNVQHQALISAEDVRVPGEWNGGECGWMGCCSMYDTRMLVKAVPGELEVLNNFI